MQMSVFSILVFLDSWNPLVSAIFFGPLAYPSVSSSPCGLKVALQSSSSVTLHHLVTLDVTSLHKDRTTSQRITTSTQVGLRVEHTLH
jgi:hypothetical protein